MIKIILNKDRFKLIKLSYLFLFCSLLIVSCKTQKVITEKKIEQKVSIQNNTRFYQSADSKQIKYHTFSSKLTCDYNSGDVSQAVKLNLRVVHDSCIWISVSPGMGIEVARIMFTPDSIFMINRLKSTFVKSKFSELKKLLHIEVDYFTLEAILTNRYFTYPRKVDDLIDFKAFIQDKKANYYYLQSINQQADLQQGFSFDSEFRLIENLVKITKDKIQLQTTYTDFQVVDGFQFPKNSLIEVTKTDKTHKIQLEYNKIELNNILEFPFRIPDSYKPANF